MRGCLVKGLILGYRMAMRNDLKKRLAKIRTMGDSLQRKLWALAVVTMGLQAHRLRPILIGGAALEYYSLGGYATSDVDLALPTDTVVDKLFADLGFRKEGRYWMHDEFDLMFEAPAADLAGEEAELTEVMLEDMTCYILGLEDLIIDRLNGYVHWKWEDDGRWVRRLVALHGTKMDIAYLRRRAGEEKTLDALNAILGKRKK
jgi:hypothetical protein